MSVDRDGEGGPSEAERLYLAEREEERALTRLHNAEVEAERRRRNRDQPTVGLWAAVAMIAYPRHAETAECYDTTIGHEMDGQRARRKDLNYPSVCMLPGAFEWQAIRDDADRRGSLQRRWIADQDQLWASTENRLTGALRNGVVKAYGRDGLVQPDWWMARNLYGAANVFGESTEVQALRFDRADLAGLSAPGSQGRLPLVPMKQKARIGFGEIADACSIDPADRRPSPDRRVAAIDDLLDYFRNGGFEEDGKTVVVADSLNESPDSTMIWGDFSKSKGIAEGDREFLDHRCAGMSIPRAAALEWFKAYGRPLPVGWFADDEVSRENGQGQSTSAMMAVPPKGAWASDRTGAPGRPTSSQLINPEFKRRCVAGLVESSLAAEARVLAEWLKTAHPTFAPMTPGTVENRIRSAFRSWRAEDPTK